jgi:hypothetical protein
MGQLDEDELRSHAELSVLSALFSNNFSVRKPALVNFRPPFRRDVAVEPGPERVKQHTRCVIDH